MLFPIKEILQCVFIKNVGSNGASKGIRGDLFRESTHAAHVDYYFLSPVIPSSK